MSDKESELPTNEDYLNIAKKLEVRIFKARETQHELILSLQPKFPSLTPSLSRSLTVSSHFNNNRPFEHIPLSDDPIVKRMRTLLPNLQINPNPVPDPAQEHSEPMLVVRSMIAVCLLKRVPFTPIGSNTLVRKLENDDRVSEAEKSALRVVGEESGTILAVEMVLKSMAEDNNGVVELEDIVINGKSSVMVMGIDPTRLVKELLESKQNDNEIETGDSEGVVGPLWSGPGPMMGPRGMGVGPPMYRPTPVVGQSGTVVKPRTEEEDLKELEALLNKKSFKEMQKSKMEEEELLDLIRRPTAKETDVAAKVESLIEKLKGESFGLLVCF